MTRSPADLLAANLLGVFGERDARRRHEVASSVYADDVRFTDPEGTFVGREVLEAKAAALLAGAPGFDFAEDGPRYVVGNRAALEWRFGPAGGDPVARSIDVITVEDGRIADVVMMLATR